MSEEDFQNELNQLTDRADRGSDAVEYITGFFEKLSKIEQVYSKALEDLTSSRLGKLQRFLGNESCEHVPEVDGLWRTLVDDVKTIANQHREISERIHTETCVPLTEMKNATIPAQLIQLQLAKKLVSDMKTKRGAIAQMEKKYHKVCREYAVETKDLVPSEQSSAETSTSDVKLDASQQVLLRAHKTNKETEASLYKAALDTFNEGRNAAFQTEIHSHLLAAQKCEINRIETVKKSISNYVDIVLTENEKVKFSKTLIELPRVSAENITVYKALSDVPMILEFHEPTTAELFGTGEVPTKKKDEGLFSSIFKPTAAKTTASATSPPPTTAAVSSPEDVKEPAPSQGGFFSFFKKSAAKPGPAPTTTQAVIPLETTVVIETATTEPAAADHKHESDQHAENKPEEGESASEESPTTQRTEATITEAESSS